MVGLEQFPHGHEDSGRCNIHHHCHSDHIRQRDTEVGLVWLYGMLDNGRHKSPSFASSCRIRLFCRSWGMGECRRIVLLECYRFFGYSLGGFPDKAIAIHVVVDFRISEIRGCISLYRIWEVSEKNE